MARPFPTDHLGTCLGRDEIVVVAPGRTTRKAAC